MDNKPIMIDGVDVNGCEDYGYRGSAGYWCHNYDEPCTDYPNCYFKQLTRKTQECERLKKKLKPKLKNAHCNYFEGQTGLCKAKEFTKCNPINCKLYTIDELSTIVDLQDQLDQLKAENEKLKNEIEACYNQVEDFDIIVTSKSNKLKQAEQKLKKIKDKCNETLGLMNKASGTNAYAGGRCIEAENILKIIDEVNNEISN